MAVYTTGGFGAPRPNQPGATPCVQAIAYSTDRGRSFLRYSGNPVLGHVRAENRDPKVIRHAATGQWIMALFLDGNDFALYGSPDLKRWRHLCDLEVADTGECPDLFELPVDGNRADTCWVFWGAAGVYRLGSFDGTTFTPETPALRCELGPQRLRRADLERRANGGRPLHPDLVDAQRALPGDAVQRPDVVSGRADPALHAARRAPVPAAGARTRTPAPGHPELAGPRAQPRPEPARPVPRARPRLAQPPRRRVPQPCAGHHLGPVPRRSG